MLRYTWLLLKLRFRLTWNVVRRWSKRRKLFTAFLLLIALLTIQAVYMMGWGLGLGISEFLGTEFLRQLPPLFFLAAYFFLFTGAFATALGELYLTSDLELLLAAPIPMRAVFTAKFARSLLSSYGVWFFLGLPAFLGLGAGAAFHWFYFFFLVLVFLTVPLIPNGLGALAVIILARYIPARRLREIVALLGGLVGVSCYVVSQLAGPVVERGGGWTSPAQVTEMAHQVLSIDLFFLPSTWAGNGLMAAGTGEWGWAALNLGLFTVASAGVYAVCLLVAERLYYVGWAGLGTVTSHRKRRGLGRVFLTEDRRPRQTTRRFPLLPSNVWAVAWKDLKYLRRDLRNLIQTAIWPLVVICVIMFRIALSGEDWEQMPRSVAAFASIGSGGMILFLIAAMFSRMSLVAISQEGRNYWMLRAAPLTSLRLLWGKLLVAYVPLLALGSVLMVIFSVLMGDDLLDMAWNLLMIFLAGLGISAIALSFGALFPKFDWDNPQRAVSPLAGILAMVFYGVYVLVVFGIFSIPRLVQVLATGVDLEDVSFALPELAGWVWAGYAVALPLALGLTLASVLVPMALAARRLDRVEV